jgi:hypothetical protein
MNETKSKSITLRRDGKGPLKFSGERIGDASRTYKVDLNDDGEGKSCELSSRLFRTGGGKYVLSAEIYNRTDEAYHARDGVVSVSLEGLVAQIEETRKLSPALNSLDDDILAELFEKTEIADRFIEQVD